MKKSKDYAKQLLVVRHNDELFIKEMSNVILEMIDEIKELVEMRNAKLLPALRSIILEQDNKWKAICRKIDLEPMESSFLECIYKLYPPYEYVMKLTSLMR